MIALVCMLALAVGESAPSADRWPGFRGNGDSISPAKELPLRWSETDNLAWKAELPGYGQSNPVVWRDRVFITAVSGEQREKGFVLAYDAKTGKKLWAHEFEPTQKAKWSFTISRAAPTPVVDGQAVYTFFEGDNLLALYHDGKPLWSRSLVKDYGAFENGHGLGGSPIQTEDAVIVLVDDRGPSYLLALDKKTGKNLWKTERVSRSSWTSPVLAMRNGKPEIVVSSNGSVAGYDTNNGKQLWEMDGLSGNTIPSASVAGNIVLIGAGVGRMGGDAAAAAKSNCCLKLVEKDGKPSFEKCWTAEKATASYATPLAYRDHAYFVNAVGVVFCIDLTTGKEVYAERIDSACWASPIGAGDRIYFFGKDGRTTVLKAGPKFEKLASNRLWEQAAPTPAAESKAEPKGGEPKGGRGDRRAGPEYLDPILYGVAPVEGAFFVRSGTTLFRIGKP